MANFTVHGLEEFYEATNKAKKIPEGVTEKMLTRMGKVLKEWMERRLVSNGILDTGILLSCIQLAKAKISQDGGSITVRFAGSRTRGKTTTRNAEIAFINEFGKKGQAARPFVKEAKEMSEGPAGAAGEAVLNEWLNSIGL